MTGLNVDISRTRPLYGVHARESEALLCLDDYSPYLIDHSAAWWCCLFLCVRVAQVNKWGIMYSLENEGSNFHKVHDRYTAQLGNVCPAWAPS